MTLQWPDEDRIPEPARQQLIGPGAPFELVEGEVLGRRMPVFARRPENLRQLLLSAADRFGDLPYLVFPNETYTFRSVLPPIASVAAALRTKYGVGKGDRVAIASANCAEYAITFWAATCLGAITVGLNGWWTGTEMAYGIQLTTPTVLLGDRRRLERLEGLDGAEPDVPIVVFEDGFSDLAGHDVAAPIPDTAIDEDDPFVILFTSGTTGRPKGAVLSHRNNIHFIQSSLLGAAARNAILAAADGGPATPPGPPAIAAVSPMFHISGLNAQLIMAMVTGGQLVYPPPGKWQEDVFLQLSAQHHITNWSLVPTQLWRLLDWPDLDRYDLSSLRGIGGGGAVWPPELLRTLEERLPGVRPGLGLGFGMSETCGLGTALRVPETYDHPDSVGDPNPGMEVQVRDPGSGAVLGDDQVGEICLRGPATFLGYWDNPEATAAALDADRWYRTGDFGHTREGLLYLQGRRRDLIIRGGENVYPIEIENRLLEHPDINEVAVIGVAHPRLGQEVKAVVVARLHTELTAEDVQAWAGQTLASFKVPTHVEFRSALPYNPAGKVMKHLLEDSGRTSDFVPD